MSNKVHFIWLESHNPKSTRNRKELDKCVDFWRPYLDGYDIMTHHDDRDLDPRVKPQWDLYNRVITRTDFLRYSLLKKYGGWYFDVDCRPNKPLKEIQEECIREEHQNKLMVTKIYKPGSFLNSDILFCEKEAPILDIILDYQSRIKTDVVSSVEFACKMFRNLTVTHPSLIHVGADERFAIGGSLIEDMYIIRNGEYHLNNPEKANLMYYKNKYGWPKEVHNKKKYKKPIPRTARPVPKDLSSIKHYELVRMFNTELIKGSIQGITSIREPRAIDLNQTFELKLVESDNLYSIYETNINTAGFVGIRIEIKNDGTEIKGFLIGERIVPFKTNPDLCVNGTITFEVSEEDYSSRVNFANAQMRIELSH